MCGYAIRRGAATLRPMIAPLFLIRRASQTGLPLCASASASTSISASTRTMTVCPMRGRNGNSISPASVPAPMAGDLSLITRGGDFDGDGSSNYDEYIRG